VEADLVSVPPPSRKAPRPPAASRFTAPFLRDLNAAQREAVLATEGPLLVLAGAGTGKTRVITCRIVHLLSKGVPAGAVLGVTFTNKAAREMRERVGAMLGRRPEGLTLSTFHALGARILRAEAEAAGLRANFTIYDESDQLSLMRDVLRSIRGAASTAGARGVLHAVALAKNRFALPADVLEGAEDDESYFLARAYKRYDEELRLRNAVDFDDLILLPVRLLQEREEVRGRYLDRFRYVLVDEYQDSNGSQYRFTRALVGPERNLCVVGDDDQSIYGFRGAEMDKILRFERDYPGARVVTLEENYRSTASILDLANAVIAGSPRRREKALRSTLGSGAPVEWVSAPDGVAEVDFVVRRIQDLRDRGGVALAQMAILFRSAHQARPFEEKLRLRKIPYTLIGGQSYFDRKEIRDALAYWNVAHNPRDDVSLLRVINFPKRGFGDAAIQKLDALARSRGASLVEALDLAAAGVDGFGDRTAKAAASLAGSFRRARGSLERGACAAACREILEEVGYKLALEQLYPDPLALQGRWGAIEDLLRSIEAWERSRHGEPFGAFLGALTLESRENKDEGEGERSDLKLMTLHSAKGLEFPVVFLPGVEEELLPHRRSIDDGDRGIEEERRLFYVGITRARERLWITTAGERAAYGRSAPRSPSRFLLEVPETLFRRERFDPDAPAEAGELEDMVSEYRRRREAERRAAAAAEPLPEEPAAAPERAAPRQDEAR
jgi:superfamily I DNA/RNA helicase